MFTIEFKIPVEIIIKFLSHLPIPYLHKTLGLNLDQLLSYVRLTGYEKFMNQLMEIGGYEIMNDGSTKQRLVSFLLKLDSI